jgi:uncharacterized protein
MENNKQILIKANEAISKGDHEGFLRYCTDDTRWQFVGDQILEGKEPVRKWMLTEYRQPPRFDIKNLIAENDYVTALGQITLIKENGASVEYTYCDVWRFRDGKMAELMAFVVPV